MAVVEFETYEDANGKFRVRLKKGNDMPKKPKKQHFNIVVNVDELERFVSWGEIFQYEAGGGDEHDQTMLDGLKLIMEDEEIQKHLENKQAEESSIEEANRKEQEGQGEGDALTEALKKSIEELKEQNESPGGSTPGNEGDFEYAEEWPDHPDYDAEEY